MADYKGENSAQYNEMNRFPNLDGVEWKIVSHLVSSETKHANIIWKLLKYNTRDALAKDPVTRKDRLALVCKDDNGQQTSKRLFLQPFVNNAWSEQCSSVYVFVDSIYPTDHMKAAVNITVEVITHAEISVINGDGDQNLNEKANPNDSNEQGDIVVTSKSRATVLLKSILAELNGLYLDGIGYLQLNPQVNRNSNVQLNLWNSRSFYGHTITFSCEMSGVSADPDFSF